VFSSMGFYSGDHCIDQLVPVFIAVYLEAYWLCEIWRALDVNHFRSQPYLAKKQHQMTTSSQPRYSHLSSSFGQLNSFLQQCSRGVIHCPPANSGGYRKQAALVTSPVSAIPCCAPSLLFRIFVAFHMPSWKCCG
jgi:hypothetical protein